jgi:hypothetical protein
MGVDSISKFDNRDSEEQTAEVYGADFTAWSLARKEARVG